MANFSQADIEAITGRPFNRSMSTRTEWRFGRKGSLSVSPEDAVWFDHETGEGGTVSGLLGRQVVYRTPEAKRPPAMRQRWSSHAQRLWEGTK